MQEYLIVHRAGEIYKLRFLPEGTELCVKADTGPFCSIHGWAKDAALNWLDDHGFEYYWESDHD